MKMMMTASNHAETLKSKASRFTGWLLRRALDCTLSPGALNPAVYLYRKRLKAKEKPLMFEVHLAEHCNLNCKGCSHFSPLAREEFADPEECGRDMARLGELLGDQVSVIHLLGGEPLLHPRICEFLPAAARCFPKARVELLTNGLLLPAMPESFWDACRENRVIIRVTKYPVSAPYGQMEAMAAARHVGFRYFNSNLSKDTFRKDQYDLRGLRPAYGNYLKCGLAGHCCQLARGRVYVCAQSAYIRHLADYFNLNLKTVRRDSIDIYKAKARDDILRFIRRPVPFCRYCDLSERTSNVKWAVSRRDLGEWMPDAAGGGKQAAR